MPSYAIVGASRGIGLEFVHQLSSKADNTVFAIVRNIKGATELQKLEETVSNVHIVHGDLLDYNSLKSAAFEVAKKSGGSLDYLINNAAFIQTDRRYNKLTDYIGNEEDLNRDFNDNFQSNVVGVIHTINAFIPLLQKGTVKKVITLTSGLGDLGLTLASGFTVHVPYSVSKAALNMVNAKYAAEFRGDGFLFLAISPGLVDTSIAPPTPEEFASFVEMSKNFKRVFPEWDGRPITPKESVELMLKVIYRFTSADTGAFVSQHGNNKEWL